MKPVRQARIARLVDEREAVTVTDLGQMLEVSEATIRRDLDELAHDGSIVRTHGGAMKVESLGKERPLNERHDIMAVAKADIARRAARLVTPGDTLFMGSGTTVELMARHLLDVGNLTVISNSLPVIESLSGASNVTLIVVGGAFRRSELSMVGLFAVDAIKSFRADRVFMGMRAIDVGEGFTGDAIDEAMTDRAILEIGGQSVVLADHTKFGAVSSVYLAPLDCADLIITDMGLDNRVAEGIIAAGVQVILAGQE
jgi:DeoR/GlpR family transcriptional regulator of sugar metabolism